MEFNSLEKMNYKMESSIRGILVGYVKVGLKLNFFGTLIQVCMNKCGSILTLKIFNQSNYIKKIKGIIETIKHLDLY